MKRTTKTMGPLGLLLLIAISYFGQDYVDLSSPTPIAAPAPASSGSQPRALERGGAIAQAFEARRSGVVVESEGTVVKLLPDDREGSPHQRFIVKLGSGHTVLFAHNIKLAPRIDAIAKGDRVAFRGQYEWNERGGVIHWTHHDPDGRRPGGWIDHGGRRFR